MKPINVENTKADDAAWLLTCSFIIITMQTGFAMLETGTVSRKNTTNIMMKNLCDVAIGGFCYWAVGYGLSFGEPSNPFCGYGDFFFLDSNNTTMGERYCHYLFHFTFASTATTIVSGAVAERIKIAIYMVYSMFNVVTYAIPVRWCWKEGGFLYNMGFYDFSGSVLVHWSGGVSAFVAAWLLGPRTGRFEEPHKFQTHDDDAAWVLTCSFIIITMQTGFAMLETGSVSKKNTTNIMMKNLCDVMLGGFAYWAFGYGLSFGEPSTPFCGYGDFFFVEKHDVNTSTMGIRYCHYLFHFTFASTSTTIVSGAVAERMKLTAYMVYSVHSIVTYSIPVSWCWNDNGFLRAMGFYDYSGSVLVHWSGGVSACTAAWMLGPRMGRFEEPHRFRMSSPSTAMTGMFMLIWASLGYMAGSTMGVSGNRWKVSAVVTVNTVNSAMAGAIVGFTYSLIRHRGRFFVDIIIVSTLGGMLSIAAIASVTNPAWACMVGAVGAALSNLIAFLMVKMKIDDPAGAVAIHSGAGLWGALSVGILGKDNIIGSLNGQNGLVYGGNGRLLGVNTLAVVLVGIWSGLSTFIMLWIAKRTVGIRLSKEDELLGADFVDHGIELSEIDKITSQYSDDIIHSIMNGKTDVAPTVSKARKRRNVSFANANGTTVNTAEAGVQTRELPLPAILPRSNST